MGTARREFRAVGIQDVTAPSRNGVDFEARLGDEAQQGIPINNMQPNEARLHPSETQQHECREDQLTGI